jgi:hypothetical protein
VNSFSTPEKIETVVRCFINNGTGIGTLGSIVRTDVGYSVAVDGIGFLVTRDGLSGVWTVRPVASDFEGCSTDLGEAAWLALNP